MDIDWFLSNNDHWERIVKRLFLATALFVGLSPAAATSEEITIRAVSAFGGGTTFSRPFESFIKWVNDNGKGILQIYSAH